MKINKILWNPEEFIENIFEKIKEKWIDVSEFELDHICYRVETLEKYIELKKNLLGIWKLLIENIIWWREISTFKLNEPIVYKNRKIFIIELPSPKKGSKYDEWYEHIEFVINEGFNDFMNKYNKIEFKKKALNKTRNPDIQVKFNNNISVKFHHNSLENVIKWDLEKDKICPCSSSEKYINCCGKYHFWENPENALILMKSRYSAYCENNAIYIMKTTHKNNIEYNSNKLLWKNEIENFSENSIFLYLEILEFIEWEKESFVTFKVKLDSWEIFEKSRFLKVDWIWLYESWELF